MQVTNEQREEFKEICKPLVKWMNDNCHPHTASIVSCSHAELTEGVCSVPILDYIKE